MATITRPLDRLREGMVGLAEGDKGVEIEGQARGDEVGAMARAVQVFKANALKLEEAEREAERARAMTDEERDRSEAIRAEATARQAEVVEALTVGLARLSGWET